MRAARRTPQRGFTLLEVLIASVLMGSVFVAVVGLMSQSLRSIDRMRPHELALLHAREKMNEMLTSDQLQPEHTTGQWPDGYWWDVVITPSTMSMASSTAQASQGPAVNQPGAQLGGYALFDVRVRVAWGDAQNPRTYMLQTTQWAQWLRQQ